MVRGYFVHQMSLFHWRIQDEGDFWPTTGKWRPLRGPGSSKTHSMGLNGCDLLEHLRDFVGDPLEDHERATQKTAHEPRGEAGGVLDPPWD